MARTLESENEPAAKKKVKKTPETKKTEKDCFDEDTVQVSNRANVIDVFVFPIVRSTTILSQCPSCASNFELCIFTCRFTFSISVLSFRIAFRIAYFRILFRTCKRGRLAAQEVQEVHEARFKGRESAEGQGQQGSPLHSLRQGDVDEAHYSGGPGFPQTPHQWHVQVPQRHCHDGEEDPEEHLGPGDHQCSLVARAVSAAEVAPCNRFRRARAVQNAFECCLSKEDVSVLMHMFHVFKTSRSTLAPPLAMADHTMLLPCFEHGKYETKVEISKFHIRILK